MSEKITDLVGEKWIKIKLNGPTKRTDYSISNYGRIKKHDRVRDKSKLLKGSLESRGLVRVNVRLVEGYHNIFPHRVVAENFLKKPKKDQKYVIHKDYDKSNNMWKNLEWATENEWKAYVLEREKALNKERKPNPLIKLNEAQVSLIKKYLHQGKTRRKIIAKRFGVTETQIKRIETGENWGHVKRAD